MHKMVTFTSKFCKNEKATHLNYISIGAYHTLLAPKKEDQQALDAKTKQFNDDSNNYKAESDQAG